MILFCCNVFFEIYVNCYQNQIFFGKCLKFQVTSIIQILNDIAEILLSRKDLIGKIRQEIKYTDVDIDRYYYLIQWKNWDILESTWQPEDNLDADDLISEYEKKVKNGEGGFNWQKYTKFKQFWIGKQQNQIENQIGQNGIECKKRGRWKYKKNNKDKNKNKFINKNHIYYQYNINNCIKNQQQQLLQKNQYHLFDLNKSHQSSIQQPIAQKKQKINSNISKIQSQHHLLKYQHKNDEYHQQLLMVQKAQNNIIKYTKNFDEESSRIKQQLTQQQDKNQYFEIQGIKRNSNHSQIYYLIFNRVNNLKEWKSKEEVACLCPELVISYYQKNIVFYQSHRHIKN